MLLKYQVENAINLEKHYLKYSYNKADLIITSPPYYDIKNYDNNSEQIGYKQTYNEFLNNISDVFQQCYKVSSDKATMWVIVDTIRKNSTVNTLPFDILNRIKELFDPNTWVLRDIIIWDKYKNVPWHYKGRFKNQFEYILFFSKSKKYIYNIDKIREIADYKKWWLTYPERYNLNGTPPSNLWRYSIPMRGWGNGYQEHLCPFPFALVERIIALSSNENDLVLDPFAGSGTVLAMANVMNRNAIGLDINNNYKMLFQKKVKIGAQKYWKSRKIEIERIQKNKIKFKNINTKLRKIKAGIKLLENLNELNVSFDKLLVMSTTSHHKNVKNIIFTKAPQRTSRIIDNNNILNEIEKVYKLSITAEIINLREFRNLDEPYKKLYEYNKDQIYKYSRKHVNKNLKEINLPQNSILSNIQLNLNKNTDVVDNITSN